MKPVPITPQPVEKGASSVRAARPAALGKGPRRGPIPLGSRWWTGREDASGAPVGHGHRPQPHRLTHRFRFWSAAMTSVSPLTVSIRRNRKRRSPFQSFASAKRGSPRPAACASPSQSVRSPGIRAPAPNTQPPRCVPRADLAVPSCTGSSACRQRRPRLAPRRCAVAWTGSETGSARPDRPDTRKSPRHPRSVPRAGSLATHLPKARLSHKASSLLSAESQAILPARAVLSVPPRGREALTNAS